MDRIGDMGKKKAARRLEKRLGKAGGFVGGVDLPTVSKGRVGPSAREVLAAESSLASGVVGHELDRVVLTLVAAGREDGLLAASERMVKAADVAGYSAAQMQDPGIARRVGFRDRVEKARALLDLSPRARAIAVETARDRALGESLPDMVRARVAKAAELAELVKLADRWGAQTVAATVPREVARAQVEAALTKALEPLRAQVAALGRSTADVAETFRTRPGR